jgi:hypothetical protein
MMMIRYLNGLCLPQHLLGTRNLWRTVVNISNGLFKLTSSGQLGELGWHILVRAPEGSSRRRPPGRLKVVQSLLSSYA